jgi:hypothetical protein
MPLLIAAVMGEPPEVVHRIQTINVLLGLVTVALVFVTAVTMMPLWAAAIVGLLVAGSPHIISLTVYVLSETPAAFVVASILALSALSTDKYGQNHSVRFVLLGALVGCLALFRPVFAGFAPFLALAYPGQRRNCLVFACLGAAVVLAPWFIRNAELPSGQPSVFAGSMIAGAEKAAGYPYGYMSDPIFAQAERSISVTLAEVGKRIAADPVGMARWYFLEKPVYLFQWDNVEGGDGDVFVYPVWSSPFRDHWLFKAVHAVFYYSHPIAIILAVMGGLIAWWEELPVSRVASLLLVFTYLAHIPFAVVGRYLVPILPAVYLLAVFAVYFVIRGVAEWSRRVEGERGANNYGGVSGAGARLRL